MNEREHRQYLLMLKAITVEQVKVDKLGSIVNSLEFLATQLEEPEENWLEDFQTEWWLLEEVYSLSIEDGRTALTEQELEQVKQALHTIEQLVRLKLTELR